MNIIFRRCARMFCNSTTFSFMSRKYLLCGSYKLVFTKLTINPNVFATSVCKRLKYSRSKGSSAEIESDDEQDDDEYTNETEERASKVISTHVASLRTDLFVKAGLGISRNKVETMFYESRFRLNGKKVLKKSHTIQVGDELDVIKGPNPVNPDNLVISRLELLSVTPKDEGYMVKLRRYKTLIVENYSESWKGTA